ncbi:hypothetical protein ADK86_02750 [Streptomyces sp. NRRL F-5755]|uniref:hypothetical protein n=1 Tax=Streptomyces sp. NRRL F-5755 TaxID=1519475 RepID=UPI0006AF2937|nr:hypothetical protein [Streptomyces sp. NRRL F-5755]KOU08858.1 hypothetical protein ADK86_02750 [Streptomyces sp. NRRL F-5755]
MTLTRRRHLVRSTAVAAVAGSALLLPAAAAFADTPQPTTAVSPGADGGASRTPTEKPSQNSGTPGPVQKGEEGERLKEEQKKEQKKDDQRKTGRKLVRTQTLARGYTAKIYKLDGPNHFQADVHIRAGKLIKTLETKNQEVASGTYGGVHFVLRSDGTLTSWAEGGDKKDEKKNTHPGEQKNQRQGGGQQTKVTPKGGVKAGAEGVGETPDTPAMLLAGGGAAAAAAGLGFALLHRRKAREDA